MNSPEQFWDEMERRKIKPAVIAAGWKPNDAGVRIPYCDPLTNEVIGHRWWGYEAKSRTWGNDGINYAATVYCTPLVSWQPEMYVVEGETSAAAMYSANIMNTVAIWGISATKGIKDTFMQRGVFRVILICDNDDAGVRGAVRLRKELEGSGIYFEARSIGRYVGNKGDVGDMWQGSQNQSLFLIRMKYSDEIRLPTPKIQKIPIVRVENCGANPDLIQRVVEECRIRTTTKNPPVYNDNIKMCSPLRNDKNPSFTINLKTGVAFDHCTLEGWSAKTLAEALGIEVDDS